MNINLTNVNYIQVINGQVILTLANHDVIVYPYSIRRLLNDALMAYDLCTLKSRLIATKNEYEFLNNSYKCPIIVRKSPLIMFVSPSGLSSKDGVYINYNQMIAYYNFQDYTRIIFHNNQTFDLNYKYKLFKQMITKAKCIEVTLEAKQ